MKNAAYCPVDDGSDCRGSSSLDKDEARRVLLSKPFEDHGVHSSPTMSRKHLLFGLFCVVLLMLNTVMLVFNLWTTTPHSRKEGFIQKPTDYWCRYILCFDFSTQNLTGPVQCQALKVESFTRNDNSIALIRITRVWDRR